MTRENLGRSWDLILLSILVFSLLVARACIQSVTIDEADAFTAFATRDSGLMWYPVAQNHLLNTMLERLAWNIFGFNQVAMRLPALLGAVIYLAASTSICSRFAGRLLRVAIFVCLAANPFVMDYLVAARGYGLAVAFLLAAIAVFWGSVDRAVAGEPVCLWRFALVSVLLALSTAANFSFGIVDIVAGVIFLAGVFVAGDLDMKRLASLTVWGTLPGIIAGMFLCISVLGGWHTGEFVYGAHSLREMWNSLFGTLFPPPNPEIVNPVLYHAWVRARLPLCLAAVIFLCVQLAALISVRRIRETLELRSGVLIAVSLSAIVALTVMLHWLAWRVFGLLLPMGRTALFIAPLLTLVLAAGADVLRREPRFHSLAIPGVAVIAACSVYFLSAFRLHYFQEWRFNEDTKDVYWVLSDVERRCGIHDFSTEWHYVSTLNFYRRQYQSQTLKPFVAVFKDSFPTDKGSYVFNYIDGADFVRENRLAIWYRNEETGATVAVRSCATSP